MKRELNGIKSRLDGIEKDLTETKSSVRRVALEVVKVKDEVRDFKNVVEAVMKSEFKKTRALITDILPLVEAVRDDRSRNEKAHMDHWNRFSDHERRLARLEARAS